MAVRGFSPPLKEGGHGTPTPRNRSPQEAQVHPYREEKGGWGVKKGEKCIQRGHFPILERVLVFDSKNSACRLQKREGWKGVKEGRGEVRRLKLQGLLMGEGAPFLGNRGTGRLSVNSWRGWDDGP